MSQDPQPQPQFHLPYDHAAARLVKMPDLEAAVTFGQSGLICFSLKMLISVLGRDCTTGYLRLPCPLPIASSNKSLQGKDPLAFPLPVQKCLELGNCTSVFQMWGEILILKKNVEFLEFFVFTLCFRTFQAKIFFQNFSH